MNVFHGSTAQGYAGERLRSRRRAGEDESHEEGPASGTPRPRAPDARARPARRAVRWFNSPTATGNPAAAQAVVMHELGHVLGLDHVPDPGELMHDENTGRVDFGPGDLEGLARLGATECR
ncbi:MAG TPA: matrixin family metalloprotease [Nocardioides sp.]|uniref:matrixin family metalloprotease n=1 Tax=Nocardioides sp. TaxID=35761 RepID=UPI002EDA542D